MVKFKYRDNGFSRVRRPSAISDDELLALYRDMLRIRRIEEAIESRYHENEMKTPIHLVNGQEATSVGICAALTHQDLLYSSHRTHGNYLAKGGSLKAMMAELYCRITGCVGSRGGSMHLMDKSVGMAGSSAICGGGVPIAVGVALALQMQKSANFVTVFFGDGAAEEGVIWESLNFSALKNVPILFVCENNYYSVCSPLTNRQPPGTHLFEKAAAFGVKATVVDGMNVLKVRQVALEAAELLRQGKGPQFIEARNYRFRGHGGSGDDTKTGYRTFEELAQWEAQCPIANFGAWLIKQKVLTPSLTAQMEEAIAMEIREAFEFARQSPVPQESDLDRFVYA